MWFKQWGWIYRPVSATGWVVTILWLAFAVHIFLFANANTDSVSDLLYGIFPFEVPAFLFWIWIASSRSQKNR